MFYITCQNTHKTIVMLEFERKKALSCTIPSPDKNVNIPFDTNQIKTFFEMKCPNF